MDKKFYQSPLAMLNILFIVAHLVVFIYSLFEYRAVAGTGQDGMVFILTIVLSSFISIVAIVTNLVIFIIRKVKKIKYFRKERILIIFAIMFVCFVPIFIRFSLNLF